MHPTYATEIGNVELKKWTSVSRCRALLREGFTRVGVVQNTLGVEAQVGFESKV